MSRVKLLFKPILISAPPARVIRQSVSPDFCNPPVMFGRRLIRTGGSMTLMPVSRPLCKLSLSKFLSIGFQLYMVLSLRIERLILNPQAGGCVPAPPWGMRSTW